MDFEGYRASFHVPDGVYFLSHSVGCLPVTAEQSLLSVFETADESYEIVLLNDELY